MRPTGEDRPRSLAAPGDVLPQGHSVRCVEVRQNIKLHAPISGEWPQVRAVPREMDRQLPRCDLAEARPSRPHEAIEWPGGWAAGSRRNGRRALPDAGPSPLPVGRDECPLAVVPRSRLVGMDPWIHI